MLNENNAYRITERLCFPRLAGSLGEKKAVSIIEEEFKKAGYTQVEREKFKTSLYTWKLAEYFFLFSSLMIIILALSFYSFPIVNLILSVIMLIVMLRYLTSKT